MTLLGFVRLVIKRLPWLIIFPGLLAGLVFYLTKNLSKEYISSTILYTGIASGVNITDGGESRMDYFAVNTAFDNLITTIKSRETLEEVGMKVLALHLLQTKPDITIINEKSFKKLQEMVSDSLRKVLVVPGNIDSTYARIYRIRSSASRNAIADIINSGSSHYSVSSILGRLTVMRKMNSDMLEMAFRADDQAVCMYTLRFLTVVAKHRYRSVKGSENQNVIRYFEEQLRRALVDLRAAEDRLKNFGVQNRIINYHEQSKYIAESKEHMTTDYYKEVMRFGASKAALERLEKKLDEREIVVGNYKDLLAKRQELAVANRKLANAKVYGEAPELIEELEYELETLQEEMRQLAKQYYKLNNTVESVPQQELLAEWLNKVIEYEESSARITVFEKRLKEYDQIYDEFAPLGSEVTRLERNVDVTEKEYLSILHGLNLANLRQQNLEMANSLTIMDEPFFPLTPQASKRMIMIIASFIAGAVLLLALFVAQEILDNAVRSPEKAVKSSGLTLAGALPAMRKVKSNIMVDQLEHSLTEQLVTSITIALKEAEKKSTYYQINALSARQGDGKTWLCQRMANRFAQIGHKVLYLYPADSPLGAIEMDEKVIAVPYEVSGGFFATEGVQALLTGKGYSSFEFGYVFLEIPFLSHNSVPYDLVSQAHVSLLVMNAERSWTSAHERTTGLYQKAAKNKVMLVLNRVTPEMLESVYGEIPKRRSPVRRIIKRFLSRGAI